jgi:hypothetical protein
MQLEVEAVHQPQRPELLLGQLAREAPLHLPPELGNPILNEGMVEFVVLVHR